MRWNESSSFCSRSNPKSASQCHFNPVKLVHSPTPIRNAALSLSLFLCSYCSSLFVAASTHKLTLAKTLDLACIYLSLSIQLESSMLMRSFRRVGHCGLFRERDRERESKRETEIHRTFVVVLAHCVLI